MFYITTKSRMYLLGVLWFVVHLAISVSNDVVVKFVGSRLPFAEITFFRFFFGTLSLLPLIFYYGKSSLKTSRILVHIIRGVLLFFAINMWAWGINLVPISTVTIMGFTIPMFVILLAKVFLKEQVSRKLWGAAFIGFIGVCVILNLYSFDFDWYSLVLVCAALMFASLDIINKRFIVQETMVGMLFYSALVTVILALFPVMNVWVTPTANELVFLALLGIGSNLILYCILKAFALVDASAVAPYRYLELVFSAACGYLLFNELPSNNTYLGSAIIIPASFYIAYQSVKFNKKQQKNTQEQVN